MRIRKIKCGNENPCAKCVASGAACSFSASIGTSRTVLSSNEQPNDEQPHVLPMSNKRRAIASTPEEDAPMRKRKVLNYENTAHFYMSSHGLSHHAGSTSGLPLLEATRRLMHEPIAPATGSNQPDWNWLQDLLQEGSPTGPTRNRSGGADDTEYFPGRGLAPNTSDDQLLRMVSEIIPPDLMSELLRVFFNIVHPVWPILHIPSFFADLYRWDSHSFAALVVSMCMLASRYVDDPRVRKDASEYNPATAGLGYCDLFSRLIDHAIHSDNVIYAIQSRFFGSMFHSVDNVPHPVAQGLVADALSRSLDGGLHRSVSSAVLGSSILREIRARTAWAVYAWDHQIAAFCGRPAGSTLWDYDVRLPEPFEEDGSDQPMEKDAGHVATFCQLIQLSALLEAAFLASVQHPVVSNSTFLTDLSRQLRPDWDDSYKLDKVMANLRKWRTTAPLEFREASPKERSVQLDYSVATEQIAALDQMIQLMVASRHLQLETLSAEPAKDKLESFRATILTHARDMTTIVVQLGASNQLAKCDITYRLLFTGRLLLACILSARSESNTSQVEEATKILHATSVVLRHFVSVFPVALGAAEVLDETIRVCRVPTPQAVTRGTQTSSNRYAWYRPIIHHDSKAAPSSSVHAHAQPGSSHDEAAESAQSDMGLAATLSMNDLSPFDVSFAFGGNMPMPTLDQVDGAHDGETDFLWLLPGGEANLPYYFPPSV
ncbi:hypothetical protein CspeluHIS016_0901620 [Cutaneotrichosporon spelunceum]|uniref:Xylanolytic transcriptional activator regulatory domain-containing protein n=1 Tax=Cutaneotrichosporon spelunceum TaxID=1672016 RepID=A0AAD3YE67_9TREE|nr:hypothetical protein CspeluHIS016_0901620 [Cutaneotrichosporon spelunceum]